MTYVDELKQRFTRLEYKIEHNRDQLAFEVEPRYRQLLRDQIDDYIGEQVKIANEIQQAQFPVRR